MRHECLINITHKNISFTFLTLGLTFHSVVHFSTACSKIVWSVCPLCEHRQGDAFSIRCSIPMQAVPVTSWLHKDS